MSLVRIAAPHFVAGIVLGKRAAPIVRYMRNWSLKRIQFYCAGRNWKVEELP